MSEPKLDDEQLTAIGLMAVLRMDSDDGLITMRAEPVLRLVREVRATRLSAEDVEALTSLVKLWGARQPNHRTRLENKVLAIASRLIGRSAT